MLEKNEYKIESRFGNEGISHTYWTGEIEDIKNVLRGQKLDQEQYINFKKTIKGILRITREIDSITKEHEERLNNNKDSIYGLETKLKLGKLCKGEEND